MTEDLRQDGFAVAKQAVFVDSAYGSEESSDNAAHFSNRKVALAHRQIMSLSSAADRGSIKAFSAQFEIVQRIQVANRLPKRSMPLFWLTAGLLERRMFRVLDVAQKMSGHDVQPLNTWQPFV